MEFFLKVSSNWVYRSIKFITKEEENGYWKIANKFLPHLYVLSPFPRIYWTV
jgi:hypothetical protein